MLPLSRTSGYAVFALACMEADGEKWILAKDIAVRVDVPRAYLAKILHDLARANVIRAKRGYRGGFMLARPAAKVSIAEIVVAVDGPNWLGGCLLGLEQCSDERACPAHTLWTAERTRIRTCLEQLTLQDVADFERRRGTIARLSILPASPISKPVKSRIEKPVPGRGTTVRKRNDAKRRK